MTCIVLVGMPGSGKSTVGRQLARRLNWTFVDSDVEIERRLGEPIRSHFERCGEASFRDAEEQVLADWMGRPSHVVATGGGAVLREVNRERMKAQAQVIYLRAAPEELIRRVRHDAQRPLLQVADPLRKLRQLYRERDPLYREVARFVVDTGRPSVKMLVGTLLMQLELAGLIDPTQLPSQAAADRSET